jgi:phosphopantetheinyl transferase
MSLFYQQNINETTRLAIWQIEEPLDFFAAHVPLHRQVAHPHKQLQHLAGRYLLQHLFADFPLHEIEIADTRKPFLADEAYHFSNSHCGDFAAAIASSSHRVGIDIELSNEKALKLVPKFLSLPEQLIFSPVDTRKATLLWSMKEALFKWYGNGKVDFRQDMTLLEGFDADAAKGKIACLFKKEMEQALTLHWQNWVDLVLSFVVH